MHKTYLYRGRGNAVGRRREVAEDRTKTLPPPRLRPESITGSNKKADFQMLFSSSHNVRRGRTVVSRAKVSVEFPQNSRVSGLSRFSPSGPVRPPSRKRRRTEPKHKYARRHVTRLDSGTAIEWIL